MNGFRQLVRTSCLVSWFVPAVDVLGSWLVPAVDSLGSWFVPAHLANDIKEVGGTSKGSTLLLNKGGEVLGEDLNHGLAGQFVVRVVLVVAAGQVTEHVPGQLVDTLDDLGHVLLEVGYGQQGLELLQLLI